MEKRFHFGIPAAIIFSHSSLSRFIRFGFLLLGGYEVYQICTNALLTGWVWFLSGICFCFGGWIIPILFGYFIQWDALNDLVSWGVENNLFSGEELTPFIAKRRIVVWISMITGFALQFLGYLFIHEGKIENAIISSFLLMLTLFPFLGCYFIHLQLLQFSLNRLAQELTSTPSRLTDPSDEKYVQLIDQAEKHRKSALKTWSSFSGLILTAHMADFALQLLATLTESQTLLRNPGFILFLVYDLLVVLTVSAIPAYLSVSWVKIREATLARRAKLSKKKFNFEIFIVT